MSRKQNWYIGRYVRAVSGFLPCSGKVKKPLLDTLRAQAEEYIAAGALCLLHQLIAVHIPALEQGQYHQRHNAASVVAAVFPHDTHHLMLA